jgi:hypothetical protein
VQQHQNVFVPAIAAVSKAVLETDATERVHSYRSPQARQQIVSADRNSLACRDRRETALSFDDAAHSICIMFVIILPAK